MFKGWLKTANGSFLLLGPRRAGKTTYLQANFPDYRYITLDDFDYLSWARRDPKGLILGLGPKAIIDEIQPVPELTVAVKQFIDEGRIQVAMTGSSSIGLLDSSAESLAGRIDICHLPTACWGEELGPPTHCLFDEELSPVQLAEASRDFEDAIQFGGFPEIVTCHTSEAKKLCLSAIGILTSPET